MTPLHKFSSYLKALFTEPRSVTVLGSGPLDDQFALAGFPLASPELEAVLRRIGQDAQALRAAVTNYTGTGNRGSRASIAKVVEHALKIAQPDMLAEEKRTQVMFVALVHRGVPAVRSVLEAAGADLRALVFMVAHGKPESATTPVPLDADSVAIFNDNFTPMEFVVGTLSDILGVDREAAIKLMLQIHREGSVRVPCATTAEAARIAEKINTRARAEYYPLYSMAVAEVTTGEEQ